MSTRLPAQVPFNDPVTVCSACRRASCAIDRMCCDAAKRGRPAAIAVSLAEVRAASLESPSYWKPQRPEKDEDLPIDVEEMRRLVGYMKAQPHAERPMMVGYLEHELGIDAEQVAEAMAAEWPEEAVSQ